MRMLNMGLLLLKIWFPGAWEVLRVLERMEWMVCHSNRKYLHQRLLPAVYKFIEYEQ